MKVKVAEEVVVVRCSLLAGEELVETKPEVEMVH